jgi:hypothetical protein
VNKKKQKNFETAGCGRANAREEQKFLGSLRPDD